MTAAPGRVSANDHSVLEWIHPAGYPPRVAARDALRAYSVNWRI